VEWLILLKTRFTPGFMSTYEFFIIHIILSFLHYLIGRKRFADSSSKQAKAALLAANNSL
jgi:hypothetical protein